MGARLAVPTTLPVAIVKVLKSKSEIMNAGFGEFVAPTVGTNVGKVVGLLVVGAVVGVTVGEEDAGIGVAVTIGTIAEPAAAKAVVSEVVKAVESTAIELSNASTESPLEEFMPVMA